MNPEAQIPAWDESSALARAHMAAMFLYVHGFLTDSEMERIDKRIDKWADNPQKEAK